MLPVGVNVVDIKIPGFVDLPEGHRFFFYANDTPACLMICKHIRPLVIFDFKNNLKKIKKKDRIFSDILHPITKISRHSVEADATGIEGRSDTVVVAERKKHGRIFVKSIFTEIRIMWEVYDKKSGSDFSKMNSILKVFLSSLRYIHTDVRLKIFDALPTDATPIYTKHFSYTETSNLGNLEDWVSRLTNVHASPDDPTIFSVHESARSLQDHQGGRHQAEARSEKLQNLFNNRISIPESIIEIEKIAEFAFLEGRRRAAVAEAMAILEMSIVPHCVPFLEKKEIEGRAPIRWSNLRDKHIPGILKSFSIEPQDTCKKLGDVIEIRHKVIHHAYNPNNEEANYVLSTVRHIISLLEIKFYREQYKQQINEKP
jgi:hypothetical protein